MPRKPKKPCAYLGCPNLTDDKYCEVHKNTDNKYYDDKFRSATQKKRYKGTWIKIRDMYLHSHPLCEECLKENRYTKADTVHHIKPLSEGGTNEETNLMSVCKSCHNKIHIARGDKLKRKLLLFTGIRYKKIDSI